MLKIVILLFILVPLVEIYLLISIGNQIGGLPTIALILLTAGLGVTLLRIQGLLTLTNISITLAQGEVPAIPLLEGIILLISGALLLTPGFFTDTIGFICLVPTIRTRLANSILQHTIAQYHRRDHRKRKPTTLDGEYREIEKTG